MNIENFIAHMICFAIYLRAVISCPRWERVVHPKSSSGTDISMELQVPAVLYITAIAIVSELIFPSLE